jgi:putative aldouronate transport system substrate-binding protein
MPNFKSPIELEQSGNLDKVVGDYAIKVITCKPDEFEDLYEKFRKELAKYDIENVLAERAEDFGSVQ